MNNIPTLRWLVWLCAVPALLLLSQRTHAQCNFTFSSQPVQVDLNLNNIAGGGTATLDAGTLSPYIGIPLTCGIEFSKTNNFTFTTSSVVFNCDSITGTTPRVYYMRSDDGGTSGIVTLHVFIRDTWGPVIPCPAAPLAFNTTSNTCGFSFAPNSHLGAVTDNCPTAGITSTWTATGATTIATPRSGATAGTLNVGTTTVRYIARDFYNNTSSCTFNVVVSDQQLPSIQCPVATDTVLFTDIGFCHTKPIFVAEASDNCGTVTVTYTATGEEVFNGTGKIISNREFSNSLNPTVITFTATDQSNHTATCSFSVLVRDRELPVIECPPSLTLEVDANCERFIMGHFLDAVVKDNCDIDRTLWPYSSISYVDNNGDLVIGTLDGYTFSGLDSTLVEWYVEDTNGNFNSCSFMLKFEDKIAPVVAIRDTTINIDALSTACTAALTIQRPSNEAQGGPAVDNNCGLSSDVRIWQDSVAIVNGDRNTALLKTIPAFNPALPQALNTATLTFSVGETKLNYYWIDENGNRSDAYTITVKVNENIKPIARCKTTASIPPFRLNSNGRVIITPTDIDNNSSDNCFVDSFTVRAVMGTPNMQNWQFASCQAIGNHVVTLTAFDAAGNTSSCSTTIRIIDDLAPVANCPVTVTVSADNNCRVLASAVAGGLRMNRLNADQPLTGPAQYKDNCEVTKITYSLLNPGSIVPETDTITQLNNKVFRKGTTKITYILSDANRNTTVCNFDVQVNDVTPPVRTGGQMPNDTIKVIALTGDCGVEVNWTPMTFADNCDAAIAPQNVSSNRVPGDFFRVGVRPVTYTVRDSSGNQSQFTFYVKVEDKQRPTARCKPYTIYLSAAGTAAVVPDSLDNGSTDNCRPFTLTAQPASVSCAQTGPQTVTLVVTDANIVPNTGTCTATVTVRDTIRPAALCKTTAVTLTLTASGEARLVPADINGSSTDNCTVLAAPNYKVSKNGTLFEDFVLFNCADRGVKTVTLRVTDGSGNSSTCTKSVAINDNILPVATAPANVTINCQQLPYARAVVTGTDNCGTVTVADLRDTSINITCANSYDLVRSWRVTDAAGNSTVVSQTIFVRDTEAPVWSVRDTVRLNVAGPSSCFAAPQYKITADSVKDNCSAFAGLTITMTVDYANDPKFTDITTARPYSAALLDTFPTGTNTVVFHVTDQCGRSATKTVRIIVRDNQAPLFVGTFSNLCEEYYTKMNTPGACSNTHQWQRPSNLFAGAPDITDCNLLRVEEIISDASVAGAIPPFQYNAPSFVQLYPTGQFPVGVTTVSYVATDRAGNKSTCSFTVEVVDTEAPRLTCPPTQVLPSTCVEATVPDYRNLVSVLDNCQGRVKIRQEVAPGVRLDSLFKAPANPPAAGKTFTITMTGDDDYSETSCSFSVRLADGNAPIPDSVRLFTRIDSCGGLIIPAPTAKDPCNPAATVIYGTPSAPVGNFLPGTPPRYNLMPGNYVITWVYNDGNGNISTQPQNITVLNDIFPPVAKCKKPFTLNLSASGMAALTTAQIDSGSVDLNKCGPVTLSLDKSAFTCADASVRDVILTAKDVKGNMAVCTTKVTIKDVTGPVFATAPRDTVLNACAAIPAPFALTATDVCGGTATVTRADTSSQTLTGKGKYNYTITRTWKTQDAAGNRNSYRQTITVRDTIRPAFSAALLTRYIVQTPGNATDCKAPVSFNIGKFVSDCATGNDLRVTSTPAAFSLSDTTETLPFGVHTFVFTAKDTTGNTSTRSVVFEVRDGTIPTAACINGISVSLQNGGMVSVTTAQVNANSFDNCTQRDSLTLRIQRLTPTGTGIGVPAASITFTCPDADAITRHKVKMFVKDKTGNESTCETYVVVQDNAGPNFTFCPPSKVVDCTTSIDPSQNNNGIATATDNCPSSVKVTYSDVTDPGTGADCLVVTRTWTAADLANNISTCVQRFSVRDTLAPRLSVEPANITVDCSSPLLTPPTITATDNCTSTADIILTFNEIRVDTASGACGPYSYTLVRTWTAKDKCNNIKTHTQRIKVQDLTAPLFLGMPDTIRFLSANFAAVNACTVPVNLDLSQYLTDCTPDNKLRVRHNFGTAVKDSIVFTTTLPVGSRKVIFTAQDLCGNVGRDSVVLITVDNSIPTVICNDNVVIALGSNSTATLAVSDIDLGSTDNCGIASRTLSKSTFNCADIGMQTISMTVTDVNGNTNACTVNVSVTLGNNPGLVVQATATDETFYGAANGSAKVTVSNGSGNYNYTWSTGATTTNISGLVPGEYIISVKDKGTQCVGLDTVVVQEGAQIELLGAQVAGAQKQVIQVPVRVRLFKRIYGFRFNSEVADTTVGKITGISNVNTALNPGFTSSQMGVNKWSVLFSRIDSIMLPDSAVLFHLVVELGTKAPTVSSDVVFSQVEFIQGLGNGPESVPVVNTAGQVTINKTATTVQIGGDIVTWRAPAKPVPGVTVTLSGTQSGTQTTAVPGTYLFGVQPSDTTIVTCSKSTPGNAQVTAADLLLIQNFLFGVQFTSPYQWVAADVDGNGTVGLVDYVRISEVVLGTKQHIQGAPDWKFVPKSHVFPAPNPLSTPVPNSIRRNGLATSFLDDDFIAVRMGDVNGNITPQFKGSGNGNGAGDRTGETFRFRISNRSLQEGEVVEVPFRAVDFADRQAYQMTIDFDADVLALEDLRMGALPGLTEKNFGTAHLEEGHLTTFWVSNVPTTLADDAVLFTLKFRVLRTGGLLADLLKPGSEITPAEAYDETGEVLPIAFEFAQTSSTAFTTAREGFALYQNRPNPFRETTNIQFRLPESARATVRIYNATGRLMRTFVGEYAQGMNTLEFRASDLGAAGVYYYELETPGFSERRKMIFIE